MSRQALPATWQHATCGGHATRPRRVAALAAITVGEGNPARLASPPGTAIPTFAPAAATHTVAADTARSKLSDSLGKSRMIHPF